MLRIACLGWGSLIWDPRGLQIHDTEGAWHKDGPEIPLEFARQSSRNRLTLITLPVGKAIPTLWTEMLVDNALVARSSLAVREGTAIDQIGVWPLEHNYLHAGTIGAWATAKGIDAVIWTALGPKFNGQHGKTPTQAEAISYLRTLIEHKTAACAEEYIRKAPLQISTPYRSAFEAEFGWNSV